jgi:hypothetical protein
MSTVSTPMPTMRVSVQAVKSLRRRWARHPKPLQPFPRALGDLLLDEAKAIHITPHLSDLPWPECPVSPNPQFLKSVGSLPKSWVDAADPESGERCLDVVDHTRPFPDEILALTCWRHGILIQHRHSPCCSGPGSPRCEPRSTRKSFGLLLGRIVEPPGRVHMGPSRLLRGLFLTG